MKTILRLLETITIVPLMWIAHVFTTMLVLLLDLVVMFGAYYCGAIDINSSYSEIKEQIKV
jgi:ABC-type arginine transport system permease subunit